MQLTILQTDSVLAQLQPAFGDYPQMFGNLIKQINPGVSINSIDVRTTQPTVIDADVYLITGSRHSVYEPLEWMPGLVEFLRQVLAAKKKIIGICFGHQLMAHFFGGQVTPAEQGWAVGVHASTVIHEHAWMSREKLQSVALLSSHKDQVAKLPQDAQLYLTNDFCPLAGFTIRDQVITVQGHPEFCKEYARALMAVRQEVLGAETYQTGIDSLLVATHEMQMMSWMLRFAVPLDAPHGD